jgi:cyanate permease
MSCLAWLTPRPFTVQAYILANTSVSSKSTDSIPWGKLLSRKEVWAIIICHFCHNWGTFILLTWMPTYYNQVRLRAAVRGGGKRLLGLLEPLLGACERLATAQLQCSHKHASLMNWGAFVLLTWMPTFYNQIRLRGCLGWGGGGLLGTAS